MQFALQQWRPSEIVFNVIVLQNSGICNMNNMQWNMNLEYKQTLQEEQFLVKSEVISYL